MVLLAIEEQVNFVLVAGDLYDGDWKDHGTGLFFVRQMGRLREAGIPVHIVHGNHDAASKMTKHLRLPENVHVFKANQPETIHLEDIGVALHGQSFATAAVTEDLSRHYPEAARGAFNIGLLHTSVDGREGHDRYAPCAIASLENRNYDYWALGHVHQREQLSPEPAIHFPGNIQGRHILENGEKGVLLVSVDASQRVTVDFRCLDVFRWAQCPIDVTGASGWSEALAAAEKALSKCISAAGDIPLAVRFLATGRTSLHETLLAQRTQWIADLRALANDIGNGQVWVEKTLISTSESEGALPPVAEGPLATLNQVLLDLESGAASLAPFDEAIDALRTKLPAELREGRELEALLSGERGASLVGDIRALLFGRLQSKEAE